MAFMMPVVKNDWDIYRSNRSRRSSECSNPARSRKVSECRSEGPSLSTSPGSDFLLVGSPPHRSAPIALRHSRTSLPSPSKSSASSSNNSSPPKSSCVTSGSGGVGGRSGSQSSLNKFHSRLVDKLKRSLKIKDALDASVAGVDARSASS